MKDFKKLSFTSQCIHGPEDGKFQGSLITPIFQNISYIQPSSTNDLECVIYPRLSNAPNHTVLANRLNLLEGAEASLTLSSGMAAISTVFLGLCPPGTNVLVQCSVYGGTSKLQSSLLPLYNIGVTIFNPWDCSTVEALLAQKVNFNEDDSQVMTLREAMLRSRLVFIEGIANPTIRLTDTAMIAEAVRVVNEEKRRTLAGNVHTPEKSLGLGKKGGDGGLKGEGSEGDEEISTSSTAVGGEEGEVVSSPSSGGNDDIIEGSTTLGNEVVESLEKQLSQTLKTPSNGEACNGSDSQDYPPLALEDRILSAIDNTILTPYILQPLKHGIDIVCHSATKYLGGHGDLLSGAISFKDAEVMNAIKMYTILSGTTMDANTGFLLERGLRTLPMRMKHHSLSALRVAEYLSKHSKVKKVNYPGLPGHPDYEKAKKLLAKHYIPSSKKPEEGEDGDEQIVCVKTPMCSGLLSFELHDPKEETALNLAVNLPMFHYAASLGSTESLSLLPSRGSHAVLTKKQLDDAGITKNLIRLSIGLEDPDDIIAALEEALEKFVE